jgi:hypothetical protein
MSTIKLKNDANGAVKIAPIGFSWTTFLFGPFPALFRGDFLMALAMVVVGFLTFWLGWLAFGFFYNKVYLDSLIKQGFRPFFSSNGRIEDVVVSLGYSADITKPKQAVQFSQVIQTAPQEPQMRCPECRELILVGAKKCKHCGSEIRPVL